MTTFQPHRPWIASHGNDVDPWPRYVSAVTGAWLFLSSLLWQHLPLQKTNAWVVGALMFTVAITAIGVPRARFANAVLALWLFVSATCFSATGYTTFNNVVVALVALVFSLVPSGHSGPMVPRRPV
ncbi:MAG TPA: hypothetical protein VMI54_01830 [Polyangiaceae bacterium]|nr:hypothetical protein [Polyangiaceae bacterium]